MLKTYNQIDFDWIQTFDNQNTWFFHNWIIFQTEWKLKVSISYICQKVFAQIIEQFYCFRSFKNTLLSFFGLNAHSKFFKENKFFRTEFCKTLQRQLNLLTKLQLPDFESVWNFLGKKRKQTEVSNNNLNIFLKLGYWFELNWETNYFVWVACELKFF